MARPVEPQRAQETIISGPYHNLIPYVPRSTKGRREGGKVGKGVPDHPTRGLGKHCKLPQWAENAFYAYLRSEISHLEHPFQ